MVRFASRLQQSLLPFTEAEPAMGYGLTMQSNNNEINGTWTDKSSTRIEWLDDGPTEEDALRPSLWEAEMTNLEWGDAPPDDAGEDAEERSIIG